MASIDELHGPIEDLQWPTTLRARVFTPGSRPHSHGFDVFGDLAQHYRSSDLILTSLRGEPPNAAHSELFDAVLAFFGPICAGEAHTHAALLARACGASTAAVAAVGAAVLAEHTAQLLEHHAPLLRWLESQNTPLPDLFRCRSQDERDIVDLFGRRARGSGIDVPILGQDPTLVAGLLAACHCCGLEESDRIAAVIMTARLPGLLAESFSAVRGERRDYPMDLPHFEYVHRDEQEGSPGSRR